MTHIHLFNQDLAITTCLRFYTHFSRTARARTHFEITRIWALKPSPARTSRTEEQPWTRLVGSDHIFNTIPNLQTFPVDASSSVGRPRYNHSRGNSREK